MVAGGYPPPWPHSVPCSLFDASDLRVVYDKASGRLSVNAMLTEAVAVVPRTTILCELSQLRGTDSHNRTTLRQDYRLTG